MIKTVELKPGNLIKVIRRINCYGLESLYRNDVVLILTLEKRYKHLDYPWFMTVLKGERTIAVDVADCDLDFEKL